MPGKFIALTWAFHEEGIPFRIWRTNTDGSGQRVLTNVTGNGVVWTCSPDGIWVYYSDASTWNGVLAACWLPVEKPSRYPGSALPTPPCRPRRYHPMARHLPCSLSRRCRIRRPMP